MFCVGVEANKVNYEVKSNNETHVPIIDIFIKFSLF